ncbi:MAG: hypothetical protein ACI9EA_001734, partial [Pseudomonadales bacterium]
LASIELMNRKSFITFHTAFPLVLLSKLSLDSLSEVFLR